MKKIETHYQCINQDEDIKIVEIVENSESFQVKILFPIPDRWRSKASAAKFYKWVAKQIEEMP